MDRNKIQDFVRLYNDCISTTSCYDTETRSDMKNIAIDMFDAIPQESVSDLVCMYMLTKALVLSVYSERDDKCTELFHILIPPYLTTPNRMISEQLQMDILRCIVFEMGYSPSDPMYRTCVSYYRSICELWLSKLNSEWAWMGLGNDLAMERLQLLHDGIEIFGISSLSEKTERAYEYYYNQTA